MGSSRPTSGAARRTIWTGGSSTLAATAKVTAAQRSGERPHANPASSSMSWGLAKASASPGVSTTAGTVAAGYAESPQADPGPLKVDEAPPISVAALSEPVQRLLAALDESQRQCVVYDIGTPLIIQAGAGSGKTLTVASRIAYFLLSGVPARCILGVCFTRQAAEALRDRVVAILPAELKHAAGQLKLKTLHSFGLECLRLFSGSEDLSPFAFLSHSSEVYTPRMQYNLARGVVQQHAEVAKGKEAVSALVEYINRAKAKKQLPHVDTNPMNQERYLFRFYQHTLHYERRAVDFGDLQQLFYQMLAGTPTQKEPMDSSARAVPRDVREKPVNVLRRLFTHIVVDEFQDLDEVQFEIIALLAGDAARVTCIGDPNQCIYSWRGAVPEVLALWKRRFPRTQLCTLASNYRSSAEIVEAANAVVGAKQSSHMGLTGVPIEWVSCRCPSEQFEAVIPALVARLRESNHSLCYGDIAVLCRSRATVARVLHSLREQGLPAKEQRGKKPDHVTLMKSLLAYLRLCVQPHSNADVEWVLRKGPMALKGRSVDRFFFTLQAIENEARLRNKGGTTSYYAILTEFIRSDMHHIHEKLEPTQSQQVALRRFVDTIAKAQELLEAQRATPSAAGLRQVVLFVADRGGFLSTNLRVVTTGITNLSEEVPPPSLSRFLTPLVSAGAVPPPAPARVRAAAKTDLPSAWEGSDDDDYDGDDGELAAIQQNGYSAVQLLLGACNTVVESCSQTAAHTGVHPAPVGAQAAVLHLDPSSMLRMVIDEFTSFLPSDDFGPLQVPLASAEVVEEVLHAKDISRRRPRGGRGGVEAASRRSLREFSAITAQFNASGVLRGQGAPVEQHSAKKRDRSPMQPHRGLCKDEQHANETQDAKKHPFQQLQPEVAGIPARSLPAALSAIPRSIAVTTVHQAKGLEWPCVVLPGCYEGEFPIDKAIAEERRIFYVAMSRAKEKLVLVSAEHHDPPATAPQLPPLPTPSGEPAPQAQSLVLPSAAPAPGRLFPTAYLQQVRHGLLHQLRWVNGAFERGKGAGAA